MEKRKTHKADLENKKFIFRQIGLIVALSLIFLAFQYKSYEKEVINLGTRQAKDIPEEIIPITEQEEKPPPPPPPKQVVKIKEVSNDADVDNDIDIDVEADENTAVEQYVPVQQEEEESSDDQQIFMVVESMPKFPGGEVALHKYLAENIRYPEMAKESGIQGRVFVTFVIEKDGSVTDVKVLRGIGGGCDEEAVRVVKNMPKWTPGKQRGKPVRVQFNLPVKFTLQ